MRPIATLLLLLAAGCAPAASATPAGPLPTETAERGAVEPVRLRTGQTVRVGAPDELRITFQRVEADSRCPRGVACVWVGDAAVRLLLAHASGQAVHTLHTGVEPRRATHGGWVVRLVRLAPEAEQGVRPAYYEATLEVTRP
jgi:hypothetical protein